jgi:apolipoprotein D and lipocalin family protein
MIKRIAATLAAAAMLAAGSPALSLAATPPPTQKIDIGKMMGRWYEVARLPNKTQRGCQAGTSTWSRAGDGFAVIQTCYKSGLTGPITEWKAKAKVVDPVNNNRIKMSFFGGMVSQEYWVLDHRPQDGWLILGTPGGNYMWLMSTKPTLTAVARSQALARVKQLGYDVSRLEFPAPARN